MRLHTKYINTAYFSLYTVTLYVCFYEINYFLIFAEKFMKTFAPGCTLFWLWQLPFQLGQLIPTRLVVSYQFAESQSFPVFRTLRENLQL